MRSYTSGYTPLEMARQYLAARGRGIKIGGGFSAASTMLLGDSFFGVTAPPANPEPLEFEINISTDLSLNLILDIVGTDSVTIDWGDGTIETYTSANAVYIDGTCANVFHIYGDTGEKTVTMTGTLTGFNGINEAISEINPIFKVTRWGTLGLKSLSYALQLMIGSAGIPRSIPSTVTNLVGMFYRSYYNGDHLATWNVSNVTDMEYMFAGAEIFTGIGLENWNISRVTSMNNMFGEAPVFNGNIKSWFSSPNPTLTVDVTEMVGAFASTAGSDFSQDLSGWTLKSTSNPFFLGEATLNFDIYKYPTFLDSPGFSKPTINSFNVASDGNVTFDISSNINAATYTLLPVYKLKYVKSSGEIRIVLFDDRLGSTPPSPGNGNWTVSFAQSAANKGWTEYSAPFSISVP